VPSSPVPKDLTLDMSQLLLLLPLLKQPLLLKLKGRREKLWLSQKLILKLIQRLILGYTIAHTAMDTLTMLL